METLKFITHQARSHAGVGVCVGGGGGVSRSSFNACLTTYQILNIFLHQARLKDLICICLYDYVYGNL